MDVRAEGCCRCSNGTGRRSCSTWRRSPASAPRSRTRSRDAEHQHHGHAQRAGVRGEGRRPQDRLRGERRHDLRRAEAAPREGVRARRARTRLSPYGISKKVVLDYLGFYQRYRGLDYTALALGNVYGPRQDPHGEAGVIAIFASKMLAGRDADDLRRREPDARLRLHRRRRARVRPGHGAGLGQAGEHRHRPGDEREPPLPAAGRHHRVHAEPGHGPLPPGELRRIALDISARPNAIGWKPWTHLEDGLGETVAYMKGI